MGTLGTSYTYHKEIESPGAFITREWKSFAVFGGGFVVVLVVTIVLVSPAFYYPRLGTDPLRYYMTALAFAHTGHTTLQTTVNGTPFNLVAMPGILRSPFVLAFSDFDTQLRAIQFSNVLLVGATAALYSYVLSWAIPRKWHWLAVGFSFGFLLLSPDWMANVFQPLADAPFAFFSLACVVIATRVFASDIALRRQPLLLAAFAVCFVISFLIRFTAVALLLYPLVLHLGRRSRREVSRTRLAFELSATTVAASALVVISWRIIRTRYPFDLWFIFRHMHKGDILVNALAYALPSQIVPDFSLGFAQLPHVDPYRVRFGSSRADIALIAFGVALSVITLLGAWWSRRRFAPEIVYTLLAIAVPVFVMNSTARYFMSYQPFFWIFFYTGSSVLLAPVVARIPVTFRASLAGMALLLFTGSALLYLRSRRMAGTLSAHGVSLAETRAYVKQVSSTFSDLRTFLETLPADRTLLIGARPTLGRWTVISGLKYYRPDSALAAASQSRDIYLLVECGTLEGCQDFKTWDEKSRERVNEFGHFSYDPVFNRISEHAKARVYRVRSGGQ